MFDNAEVGTALKAFRVLRILRMFKLLRFVKMMRLLNGLLRQLFSRELAILMRLCRFLFVMILFAHFCACGWFAVGNHCYTSNEYEISWIESKGIENSSLGRQYSMAAYWSVVTLMTTGYGDITATNVLEEWAATTCIVIGTCFFAYFVGAVGSLLADGDRVRAEQNEKIEQAQQFCAAKKFPKDLSHAVITHTKYHCKHNFLFDEATILSHLPTYLKYVFVFLFLFLFFHHLPHLIRTT